MLIFAIALLASGQDTAAFPEQVPALIEACVTAAVVAKDVTDTEDSHKYICAGDTAAKLWAFLERAKIRSYEQETPEGVWLSREFPLGGCFKRVRLPDGKPASGGLSCTIWVPRVITDMSGAKPASQ
jgi:hypothetical protein